MQNEFELPFMIPGKLEGKESRGFGRNCAGSGGNFEMELSRGIGLSRNMIVAIAEFDVRADDDRARRILHDARSDKGTACPWADSAASSRQATATRPWTL